MDSRTFRTISPLATTVGHRKAGHGHLRFVKRAQQQQAKLPVVHLLLGKLIANAQVAA